MKDITKLISVAILAAIALGSIREAAADEIATSESGYYSFSSAALWAEYKSKFLPVISGNNKGVFVNTEKGLKRIRYSAPCRLTPRIGLTENIVNISEIKISFNNLRLARVESDAVATMDRAAAGTELEILNRTGGIAGGQLDSLPAEEQEEFDDMRADQRNLENNVRKSIEDGDYAKGEWSDIVDVKYRANSERDIENAFCAMHVVYQRKNPKNPDKLIKAKFVQMKKLGNLRAGIPRKIRFSSMIPEGLVSERDIEFFLFSGEGKPLATNHSKKLRPVSKEVIDDYLRLQAKAP